MSYRVWVDPPALKEAQRTPGNVRQRIKKAMLALQYEPRPHNSNGLEWPPENFEPRRMKIGKWRIIYAVNDPEKWVEILAIRKRPPYNYDDLAKLLSRLD